MKQIKEQRQKKTNASFLGGQQNSAAVLMNQKDPLEELDRENQDSLFQDIRDKETDFYFLSQAPQTIDEMQLKNFTAARLVNLTE